MITTLSVRQISNFLINTSNRLKTIDVPRNNQTFHQFISSRYINAKRNNKRLFSPFLFQCFYFIYQDEINQNLSKPNTDGIDIQVKFDLKRSKDVYIMDGHNANKYFNSLNKNFKDLSDHEIIEYYYLLAKTFKSLDEYDLNEDKYTDKIYLLQRHIYYNDEIVEIYHEEFNDILMKVNNPDTYKPKKKGLFKEKIMNITKFKSKQSCVIS